MDLVHRDGKRANACGWGAKVMTCLAAACLVALVPVVASAYSYDAENSSAMALFQMGGSARGQAMGGAYAALARGAEAAYWNPGGLPYQRTSFEIDISPRVFQGEEYELGDDARGYFLIQAAWRWRTWAISGSYLRQSVGDILYNDGGADGGGDNPNDVSLDRTFSYGQSGFIAAIAGTFMDDHLGVGVAFKQLNSSFDDLPDSWSQENQGVETSGSGMGIQAGVLYRINEDVSAAAVVDLPTTVDWGRADKDEVGYRIQTGAAFRFLRTESFLGSVGGQLENTGGSWARAHAGLELTCLQVVSLRAGVKNFHLKSSAFEGTEDLNDATAFTLGAGTCDLHLMDGLEASLDVAFDWQDFNSQITSTLKVGF